MARTRNPRVKDCNQSGTVALSALKYASSTKIVKITDRALKTRILVRYSDRMDTDFDVLGILSVVI